MANREPQTFRVRRIPAEVPERRLAGFLCQVVQGLKLEQVHVLSLAPTPDDHNKPPSQTATVEFAQTPATLSTAEGRDEWPVAVPGQRLPLVFDLHFLGFTPLNKVEPGNHDFE